MRHSPLLRKYISYNMLFILVPMLILIAVYVFSAREQIITEYETSLQHALQQSMRIIDADMDAFRQTASQIALDADVTPYQLSHGRYETVTALKALRGYHTQTAFLEGLMLYLRGGDKLYAGAGVMNLDLIGTARYPFLGGWTGEGLTDMLSAAAPFAISPPGTGIVYNNLRCLVITYPWARPAMSAIGSVVGLLPEQYFAQLLQRPRSDAAFSLGLKTAGDTWLYRDGDADALNAALLAGPAPGASRITLNGQRMTAIYQVSEQTAWRGLLLLPHDQFLPRLLTDHGLVLTWVSILLLVCIAAGILIAVRNYLPIQRIDRMLDAGAKDTDTGGAENELHRIDATLKRLAASNQSMQKQLSDSRQLQTEQLAYRLLHARPPQAENAVAALGEMGIALTGPLCVLLISGEMPLSPPERERLMDILRASDLPMLPVELGVRDYIAALVILGGQTQPVLASRLLAALLDGGAAPVRLAAGRISAEAARVGRSLSEAIAAMETLHPAAGQVAYFQQTEETDGAWMPPRSQLAQWLAQGDEELVRDSLAQLKTSLHSPQMRSDILRTRYVATAVLQQVLPLMEAGGVPPDSQTLERIVHFSDAEEFMTLLTAMTDRLLSAQRAQRSQRQSNQYRRMLAYIDAHYTESSFGLKTMAAALDMTNSYLSRFFRDHADMNFSDYVTRLRMERACALLRGGSLRIREVVEQVGYLDVASFTRKFTQVMGITPGRYRDLHRAEEREDA